MQVLGWYSAENVESTPTKKPLHVYRSRGVPRPHVLPAGPDWVKLQGEMVQMEKGR